MKNITILVLLIFNVNLFGQKIDFVQLEEKLESLPVIKQFEKSIFNNKSNTIVYTFNPKYVRIDPSYFCHYLDSCNKSNRIEWHKLISSKNKDIIDSSYQQKTYEEDKIFGVYYLTAMYDNYIIMELYYTKRNRGHICSKVIGAHRLQLLFLIDGDNIILINQLEKEKVNQCIYLD